MPQPFEHLDRVSVRREDRVENLHDHPLLDDERQTLVEPAAVELEGWQGQGRCKDELVVADDRKRHLGSFCEFHLLGERLRRDAGETSPKGGKLSLMVAEAARLRCAAARSRNFVPT